MCRLSWPFRLCYVLGCHVVRLIGQRTEDKMGLEHAYIPLAWLFCRWWLLMGWLFRLGKFCTKD